MHMYMCIPMCMHVPRAHLCMHKLCTSDRISFVLGAENAVAGKQDKVPDFMENEF